jgi:hypothetical protein
MPIVDLRNREMPVYRRTGSEVLVDCVCIKAGGQLSNQTSNLSVWNPGTDDDHEKGSRPRGSRHPCPETHNPELRSFVACPQRGCGFRDLQCKRGRTSRAGTLGWNRVPGQNRDGSKSYTGPCIVSDVLVRTGPVLVVGVHDVMAGHRCQVNFERQALRPGHGFRLRRKREPFRFRGCTSVCRKEKAIARAPSPTVCPGQLAATKEVALCCWWLCVVAGCDDGRYLANHASSPALSDQPQVRDS